MNVHAPSKFMDVLGKNFRVLFSILKSTKRIQVILEKVRSLLRPECKAIRVLDSIGNPG